MSKIPGCRPRVFDSFYRGTLLGIDEVGVGCIAGPVCAAGVVLPRDDAVLSTLESAGLRDSKEMGDGTRRRVFEIIERHAVWKMVLLVHPREIEELNIYVSVSQMCSQIIAQALQTLGDVTVIIDGKQRADVLYQHEGIVKGDAKSLTIAAAATYAKVTRDNFMIELAESYPGYGWDINYGYPTPGHIEALEKLGATDAHRGTTKPVRRKLLSRDGLNPELSYPEAAASSARTPADWERPLAGVNWTPGTRRG